MWSIFFFLNVQKTDEEKQQQKKHLADVFWDRDTTKWMLFILRSTLNW